MACNPKPQRKYQKWENGASRRDIARKGRQWLRRLNNRIRMRGTPPSTQEAHK